MVQIEPLFAYMLGELDSDWYEPFTVNVNTRCLEIDILVTAGQPGRKNPARQQPPFSGYEMRHHFKT
jgi:hypothetical protein